MRAALLSNAHAQPSAPAFSFRTGEDWTTWTWADTARIALATGRALRSKYDLEVGSAIVLDVPNGPVWLAVDLGAQMVGAYTIPIYAGAPDSSAQSALETIRTLANPKVLLTHRPAAFEGFESDGDVELATVEYLLDLVRRSYETDASGFSDNLPSEQTPDIVCGVYVRPRTSDVEGGRVLAASQQHIAEQCSALKDAFEYTGLAEASGNPEQVDRRLSVMPWAHIIERIQAVYSGIEAGIPTYVPCSPRDLLLDFGDAEPTLFSASSQMYDHLRDRLIDSMYEVVGDAVDLPQAFDALETQSAMSLFGQDVPRDLAELAEHWRDALEPVAQDLLGGSLRLLTSAFAAFRC